ncbi:uncharacterized protein [Antedon mediterranea]|uniref:uncharacterized protein n=1 Tax=Antedon mediterranea TaxID=105859 RepID=UPI003AF652F1
MSSQEVPFRCQYHPDNIVERFCTTCTKSACKDCEHFVSCYTEKHDTKPMIIAADEFNKIVNEAISKATDMKQELEVIFNSIVSDDREFKLQVDYIKKLIENHVEVVVKKVKEESEKLMMDLDIVCKQKEEAIERQVKELEQHQMQLQNLKTSVTEMTDKPECKTILDSYKSDIEEVKQNINTMEDKFSSYPNNLTPNFTIKSDLDDAISNVIGKITSVDKRYIVNEEDKSITVIKGQPFAVMVKHVDEWDTCALTATLINPSRDNIELVVGDIGSGGYSIKSTCNDVGKWKMNITNGFASIKGSPVNITVLPTVLHTIDNIGSFKIDNRYHVTDVTSDKDGCLLVPSYSNELLKFNQSGSFIANIQIPNVQIYKVHRIGIDNFMLSDAESKSVVMCNEKFKIITQFGQGILEYPVGLAVNNDKNVLYIADIGAQCVYKFNIDSGELMGKIGSGSVDVTPGTLIKPHDVTLTMDGNLLVPDWHTNKIQLFSANGTFMKTIVDGGKEDGTVWNPTCIVMDMDENLIVSSDHKLQLFDKNGTFIKRIDEINDDINSPDGLTVIGFKPRRLAVANCGTNTVKIFNY